MQWIEIIIGALSGNLLGILAGVAYFRPRLQEAKAGASKASTEAKEAEFEFLRSRLDSIEKLYMEQGKALDQVRAEFIELSKQKAASDQKVAQLEIENKDLRDKIGALEVRFRVLDTNEKGNGTKKGGRPAAKK